MKKIFYSMFALIMALSFASCEDVPAPYDDPANGGNGEATEGTYLEEEFTANKGKFDVITPKGQGWKIDHSVMTASGFDFDTKTTIETETYLVSPAFDLSKSEGAYISFKYINMYVTPEANFRVLISDKYTGQPETTEWKDLSIKWEESVIKDWETYFDYNMNIPAELLGKENVVLALGFKCSSVKSSTFKVKSLIVKDGVVEDNPGGGDEPVNPGADILKPVNGKFISETFGDSFGVFSVNHISGTPWLIDFHTAKASGYDNQTKETTASNSYLVSKPMDMTSTKEASINFEYLLKYVTFNDVPVEGVVNEVLITDNYTGDANTTQWTKIDGTLTEYKEKDWSTFFKYDVDIPAQFMGKEKVVIALHYACGEKSGTWEVKNLNVVEAKAGQGGGEEPGQDELNVGDTNTPNGDFETWVKSEPNNWFGPASKANLFYSEDAHSGKYSVQVGGNPDGNMRLGYKILNLKAGHYVMKFFVKAVTAEGGSARPGYVVLTDGKPTGGNDYKYGDYINDLKNDAWTEASYEFDIEADGEYTVVVMNAKKPGKDILVDDFTLEYNGEFIIK